MSTNKRRPFISLGFKLLTILIFTSALMVVSQTPETSPPSSPESVHSASPELTNSETSHARPESTSPKSSSPSMTEPSDPNAENSLASESEKASSEPEYKPEHSTGEPESSPETEPETTSETEPVQPEAESTEFLQTVTFVMLYSICMLLIIVGNVLIVVIVLRSEELRSNTSNLQLLSLVTARAAIGVFVVPASIASMFSEKELGGAFCKICHYCATTSGAASIFSIIAIAIVKYRTVVLNIKTDLSMRRSIYAILLIWVASLIYAIRTPIIYDLVVLDAKGNTFYSCTVAPDFKTVNSVFMIVDAVFLFTVPLMTISFCYSRVMKKLALSLTQLDEETRRTTARAIQMLAILITLFTVCTLPPYVMKIYVNWIGGPFEGMNAVMLSVNLFSYSNGWFNLIVFAVYRDDLRRGFKQLPCVGNRNKRVVPIRVMPKTFPVLEPERKKDLTESFVKDKMTGDIIREFNRADTDKTTEAKRRQAMMMMEF